MSAASRPGLTRETAPPSVLDTSNWPTIDLAALDDDEKTRATALETLVSAYVRGEPVARLLGELGMSSSQLLRTFNKCIRPAPDGRLYGWRGLLSYVGRKAYERASADDTRGKAGLFAQCLDSIAGLRQRLIDRVLGRHDQDEVAESRVSAKQLHRVFIEECRQAGIPADRYPFNRRTAGRRSIERFLKDVVDNGGSAAIDAQFGETAATTARTGRGQSGTMLAVAPFDVAEMDSHRIDLIGTVRIPTDLGLIRVPIERLQLVLIADPCGTAVHGFYVVIRRECNSGDLLQAASCLTIPWTPRALRVEGMSYKPGGGLPFGVIEGMRPRGFAILKVDRALVNLGYAVVERIAARFGCAVNWGPPRQWYRRPIVERIFGRLEQVGFQRLITTVGSGPGDPRRRQPAKAAVDVEMDIEEIIDLVHVEIADYMAEGGDGTNGLTRMDVVRQSILQTGAPTLPTLLPAPDWAHPELDVETRRAWIRGSRKKGRRGVIKFRGARYTNPVIANAPHLLNAEVVLHFRRSNIVTLEVYLKATGESLGVVTAMGRWAAQPHSLEFRLQINRHVADGRLKVPAGMDPVTAMNRHLAKKVRQKHKAGRPKTSPEATVLARESQVTNTPVRGHEPPRSRRGNTPQRPRLQSRRAPTFRHFR